MVRSGAKNQPSARPCMYRARKNGASRKGSLYFLAAFYLFIHPYYLRWKKYSLIVVAVVNQLTETIIVNCNAKCSVLFLHLGLSTLIMSYIYCELYTLFEGRKSLEGLHANFTHLRCFLWNYRPNYLTLIL